MKVIFLDIDGVLNEGWGLKSSCLNNLRRIVKQTGVKLVISSTWRLNEDDLAVFLHNWNNSESIIGVTEDFSRQEGSFEEIRAREINHWLQNNPKVEFFVVLDDLDIPINNLWRTDGDVGLTLEMTDNLIDFFNKTNHAKEAKDAMEEARKRGWI